MKPVKGRLLLLALFVFLAVILFLPSYSSLYQTLPAWMKRVLPDKGIALGLDLQGGIHLVLQARRSGDWHRLGSLRRIRLSIEQGSFSNFRRDFYSQRLAATQGSEAMPVA